MNILRILVSSCIILFFDFLYLGSHAQYFKKVFTQIQGKSIIRYFAAILCYLAMIALLNIFIIQKYSKPTPKIVSNAFLLGFLTYIIYDLTNYATIEKWPLYLVIVDSVWGGSLFAITSYITMKFVH